MPEKIIVLFLLLFCSQLSFAMPDDRLKILELSADSADLNQQKHKGEYLGNVTLDQGTTHLRAAKAVTNGNEKNKLVEAIASGDGKTQAHYWTMTAINKPLMHAYADIIRYYPDRHLIELTGNARVEQGKNSFQAPHISYDTMKQHVLTRNDGKNRTTIIIHPEKKA